MFACVLLCKHIPLPIGSILRRIVFVFIACPPCSAMHKTSNFHWVQGTRVLRSSSALNPLLDSRYAACDTCTCEEALVTFTKVPLNVQSLPEANFRQLLALLPLSQRIRSAELVSKRWRQALRDQEVLSVVDFASDSLWRNQVPPAVSILILFTHLHGCATLDTFPVFNSG